MKKLTDSPISAMYTAHITSEKINLILSENTEAQIVAKIKLSEHGDTLFIKRAVARG